MEPNHSVTAEQLDKRWKLRLNNLNRSVPNSSLNWTVKYTTNLVITLGLIEEKGNLLD